MRGVLLSPPQGRGFRETRGELLFVASGQEAVLGLPQMFSQLAQQFDTVRPISIFQPGSWDLGESLLPSCTGMRDDSQARPHSVHTGVGVGGPHAGENLSPWPSCSLWVETIRGVSPSAAGPGMKSPDASQAHAGILMSLGLLLNAADLRYSPSREATPRQGL